MAEIHPIPFTDLLWRMRSEVRAAGSIFDLPIRKWHIPDGRLDLSAVHFSRRAATPVGPAAGPHTQLAQNIVLAWLAGGRIIELKTVQIKDRLEIPRPCIHVPNIGYNVEWSQELRIGDSLAEYAKAAYLIEILKSTRGFGVFPSDAGFETVFDISVGYDLEGIRSSQVVGFIRSLQQADGLFDGLRGQLTGDLREFRDTKPPPTISDCVTLSTFHGCPADQIESIARFLLEEMGLHVIIKLNPTLLGFQEVRHLLHDRMGYTYLTLRPEAFEADLQYADGLEILRRLRAVAAPLGSIVGAKFTNTLVVENDSAIFPTQTDPYMYVSGPPLHVISMTLMQRFREELGFEFPVSFSAGIDAKNFPVAVACGMVPVTTCTDLLRQGGFGRLPAYLRALGRELERCGVTSREAYVLAARGNGWEAAKEALSAFEGGANAWLRHGDHLTSIADTEPDALPAALRALASAAAIDGDALVLTATRVAGRLNGRDVVPLLPDEERYHASQNTKLPRRIDSVLSLYDCVNCDLCVSACPNDAIFIYDTLPVTVTTEQLSPGPDGDLSRAEGEGFVIGADHQLGVFEGACNECSNCEVYCPEEGAPFRVKKRFFSTRDRFEASEADGFFRDRDLLLARLDGRMHQLEVNIPDNRARLSTEEVTIDVEWEPLRVVEAGGGKPGFAFDTSRLWRMKTAWDSVFHSTRPNPVNPEGQ
ncbi:MAG: 4Fe-4S binding protein [Acidobacteriota bacterium]